MFVSVELFVCVVVLKLLFWELMVVLMFLGVDGGSLLVLDFFLILFSRFILFLFFSC